MTNAQAQAMAERIEALEAQLAAAQKAPVRALTAKVSEKGGISVYGLQRMPVTLYVEQWERLLDFGPQLLKFAQANNRQLTRKNGVATANGGSVNQLIERYAANK
jgi:hypothetical protein